MDWFVEIWREYNSMNQMIGILLYVISNQL